MSRIYWLVDCGLTSHSAIFQLYSDGTDVQFPNFDLLLGIQSHGQLGVFSVSSLPQHGHRDVRRRLLLPCHCGLTSHSAIFQLYSDGTVVQFPNYGLLLGIQSHGQLGVFSVSSLPRHGHWDVRRRLLLPCHQRAHAR